MPQVAVIAVVYGAAAVVGLITIEVAIMAVAMAAVSYAISDATKPKAPNTRFQSVTQLIRSPLSAHRLIYGEMQVAGTLVYATKTWKDYVSTRDRSYLHLVIAVSGRELTEIGEIYLNDLPLSTTGRFWPNQLTTWTAVTGGAFVYSAGFFTVFHSGLNVGDVIRTSGFAATADNGIFTVTGVSSIVVDETATYTISVAETLVDEVAEQGQIIDHGLVRVNRHLGATDQLADADLVADVSQWTTNHRLRGRAYVYLRLEQDRDAFPTGIPNIKMDVKGHAVYDPRSTTTAYSVNAALCTLDHIRRAHGIGSADAEIDMTTWIAAANASDEVVDLGGGQSQLRYTCNGAIDLDSGPVQVLDMFKSAMAGAAIWSMGTWRGYAGVAQASIGTIDPGDFRGAVTYRNKPGRDERFNGVRGTFRNPADHYQPTDFVPVVNATYETEDGSEQILQDIDLPFTNDAIASQRMAKIVLENHRQGLTATLPLKLGPGLTLSQSVWGIVAVNLDLLGWTNKLFRIRDWSLVVDGDSTLGVNLIVQEYADAVYDWAFGEATTHDLAPNTDLPDPTDVTTPTGLLLSSGTNELYISTDGTVTSRLRLDWDDPEDTGVYRTEIQYKLSSVTDWTEWNSARSGETGDWISQVQDGIEYDVQIRHVNLFQVSSDWLQSLNHAVIGKSAPPADVSTFLVERQPDGTRVFTWSPVADPDLAGYLIRARLGSPWTWAELDAMHEGVLTASPWETNLLAAGDYTIAIKAIDTTGNESANATAIISTLGDPRIKNAIVYVSPHLLAWPGTKTNCEVDSVAGALTSLGNYAWDDLTTWDAWTAWATPSFTSIIYEHTEIDIGVIVPFIPLITVDASNTPTIEINYSSDGISYSGWVAPAGQITASYLKVRVTVAQSVSEIPQVFSMTIIASGDTIEEDIPDSVTSTWSGSAAAGRVVPIQKSYSVILSVQLALQSVGAGWTWEVLSKATTGPIIRIYNSSGVASDATVDVVVKGMPPT